MSRRLRGRTHPTWVADALCAEIGRDLFHPDKGGSVAAAKRICAACPVKAECLAEALADEPLFGVYGGTTVRERQKMRRKAS